MADPISEKYYQRMNDLARWIDHKLNGTKRPKRIGFVLLQFEFGEVDDGRVNYISNADRKDMITAMTEFLARAEGRLHDAPPQ